MWDRWIMEIEFHAVIKIWVICSLSLRHETTHRNFLSRVHSKPKHVFFVILFRTIWFTRSWKTSNKILIKKFLEAVRHRLRRALSRDRIIAFSRYVSASRAKTSSQRSEREKDREREKKKGASLMSDVSRWIGNWRQLLRKVLNDSESTSAFTALHWRACTMLFIQKSYFNDVIVLANVICWIKKATLCRDCERKKKRNLCVLQNDTWSYKTNETSFHYLLANIRSRLLLQN